MRLGTALLWLASPPLLAQSGGPVAGGGPLAGPVSGDFGIKPLPEAPAETDFWLSEAELNGRGSEVRVNTSFDWSKVTAKGYAVGAGTPGWLKRPHWLPYPWQDLPYVDIQPLRGQSRPGGKNYQLYKAWEERALDALPPMDRAAMHDKKWYAGTGNLMSAIRMPIAQLAFNVSPDGAVQGTVWLPKRREKPDPEVKDSKDRIYLQQIKIVGLLSGDRIQFDAAGLHGELSYVGKGYGLRGEFADRKVDSLISPLFEAAWTNLETTIKKPLPEPTESKTSYGAPVTKWE